MFTTADPIVLSASQREELNSMVRSRTIRSGLARRAALILALAEGASYDAIQERWPMSRTTIGRWKRRFQEGGISALMDAPRSGRGNRLSPAKEARIIKLTQDGPPKPLTHWSARRLARVVGVSHATVHRVWQRAGLKPHQVESYVATSDPLFEEKAADIIGLYLKPPAHAAVFCVDEKTAIQALDRTLPVLPLSPGRAERHGFEYVRNGTLSLYAALEVGTGNVKGFTAERHTSENFVRFLDQVISTQPRRREIHIICDNLSAHKTKRVQEWLAAHSRVTIHYTPTYSSWLNQVELWFSKIQREMIARGIFTSVADLRRKLMQYIRLYNKNCRPFTWSYSDPTKRIRSIGI
jgi:transposase